MFHRTPSFAFVPVNQPAKQFLARFPDFLKQIEVFIFTGFSSGKLNASVPVEPSKLSNAKNTLLLIETFEEPVSADTVRAMISSFCAICSLAEIEEAMTYDEYKEFIEEEGH